jgi:hypothetical protein
MGFNDKFALQKILNGPCPFGLGCSLIPGAPWLCRRRMLRCLGRPRFTAAGSARAGCLSQMLQNRDSAK